MIGTVTLNPSVDQHLTVPRFVKDDAIRAVSVRRYAGGKGINVARAIHELGGAGCAFGVVGGFPGQMLTHWLDEAGIAHHFLSVREDTRINTTITDLSDRTQTHIRTPGPKVSPVELERLADHLMTCRPQPGFWVLGGSLPPGVPDATYKDLIERLESTGARCVLDTDDEALTEGLDATPFLIKPNEHEFQRLTGEPPKSEAQIVAAARRVVARGVQVVLVTLGPRGAVAVTAGEAFRVTTPPVEVKSRVGAGDSTIAGLLVALEREATLPEAVRYGVAAGTAAVLSEGTTLCARRDVERLLPQIRVEPL